MTPGVGAGCHPARRFAIGARLLPLVWLAAVFSLCWLYYPGLQAWFCADDFAWLGLLRQSTSFHSLLNALFRPEAQGTMRFISERGFFILFERLFGLDNLPWRIAVFATAAGDIALIIWLTRRITGSALAAAIAPFLWLVNRSLATVMAWDSSYNEVLCPLFLMAALALFVRYAETGRSVFWWCQLVVFTLGFGVLEVNTVYPALAAAWILAAAPASPSKCRTLLLSLLPLTAISIAYFLIHRAWAPFLKQGPYAFQIDRRVLSTFALYWKWSLVPESWDGVRRFHILGPAILALETLALLGSCLRDLRAGRRQSLFYLAWFVLTIGPLLPLPNHRTDYYLTIPIVGLSMLAASSVARLIENRGSEIGGYWRPAAAAGLAAIYLLIMIPAAHAGVLWWYERSYPLRALVLGVDAAQKTHPDKIIVMDGITDAMWDDGFAQGAFYPIHVDHVYLTPDSTAKLHPSLGLEHLPEFVLDPAAMHNAITHSQVVVYSVVNDHLRNITNVYARSEAAKNPEQLQVGEPRRVDVGSPLFSYLLGPEWFPPEAGFRWMPSHASLRMGGPRSPDDVLVLDGYFPDLQRKGVFAHLSVAIDRIPVGSADMNDPDGKFHRLFKVPALLVGKDQVEVELSVDPVLHGQDGHNRGLVFGSVSFERSIFNPN